MFLKGNKFNGFYVLTGFSVLFFIDVNNKLKTVNKTNLVDKLKLLSIEDESLKCNIYIFVCIMISNTKYVQINQKKT
jgi:hypothetical protein